MKTTTIIQTRSSSIVSQPKKVVVSVVVIFIYGLAVVGLAVVGLAVVVVIIET